MGARPSSFKAGGGFLNNVAAVITGYEWTSEAPGGASSKSKKKSDFNSLFFKLAVRVDGANEDVETHLFAGNADDFEIEDDGANLSPVDGSELRAKTAFALWIGSLCDKGFPETALPEDSYNYAAIIGTRVQLAQVVDEDATKRLGKRKGKDGKEYNRTNLLVTDVMDLPKAGGKSTAAKGKAGKTEEVDLDELAQETLVAILGDCPDNNIQRDKLTVKVLQKLGAKHPQKDAVRKLIISDEFLATEAGWTYDAKKKLVELA